MSGSKIMLIQDGIWLLGVTSEKSLSVVESVKMVL